MNCIFGVEHLSSSDEIEKFLSDRDFYEHTLHFDNTDGTRFTMIANYFPITDDKLHAIEVISFFREDSELSDIPDEVALPYLDSKIENIFELLHSFYAMDEEWDDYDTEEEWDELDSINPLPYDDY